MEMVILGSNGTYPTAGRPASGYLIAHQGVRLWMDAGPGTYMSLCARMDPRQLDAVFISHRHPDHCSDLLAFFHALAYGPHQVAPVPVVCPPGFADTLSDFVGGSSALKKVFDFVTADQGSEIDFGTLHLSTARCNHPPPTLACRIGADGKVLTYTADTGPSRELEKLAAGSDLLLAEASLQEPRGPDAVGYHMTGREAGEMASRAQVSRLMLTHIAPYLEAEKSVGEAESEFAGPVSLAVPGAQVLI